MQFTAEESQQIRDALKRVTFLQHLKMGELDAVISAMDKTAFRKGETLIRQGAYGNTLYLIAAGSLGVYKRAWLILKQRIATRRRGEFVGEMALLDNKPRNATHIADDDGQAYTLTRAAFDGVLLQNPSIAALIRQTAENRHIQDRAEGF